MNVSFTCTVQYVIEIDLLIKISFFDQFLKVLLIEFTCYNILAWEMAVSRVPQCEKLMSSKGKLMFKETYNIY